ncbi:MAG: NAD(+) synthase [Prevotellaceae bacterium]|nr:NAD(+) synthase [Prevotellaceae bacterium]
MSFEFVRCAAAVPDVRVADCPHNAVAIAALAQQAEAEGVQLLCFPELCITGYTCADLFFQERLQREATSALDHLRRQTESLKVVAVVGLPLRVGARLYNVAAVLQAGKIVGIVPKINLPNGNEFYEKRWFASGASCAESEVELGGSSIPFGVDLLFSDGDFTFGIEICEDLWMPIPPSSQQALHGAEIILNPSASNELVGKHAYRMQLIGQQSARCNAGYVYASAGRGESTTDVVFTGNAVVAENGKILAQSERFAATPQLVVADVDVERLRADRMRNSNFAPLDAQRYRVISLLRMACEANVGLRRIVPKHPFVPPIELHDESCREILSIQIGGLAKRWQHTQSDCVVLGVSGGLDSTLALLVCAYACDALGFDRSHVLGLTMPGFGTTKRTHRNALSLMKSLGVTWRDIPIGKAVMQHFKDIGHNPDVHDVTYENSQARERTQILMDMANQQRGLVIGTGDLSELALGWATYNGDQMSMYGVNSGVPKTLVRALVEFASRQLDEASKNTLRDVLNTPVSPELLPAAAGGDIAQRTEDIVGPYELHDFFLYYMVRFGFSPEKILFLATQAFKNSYADAEISRWLKVFLRRFFAQQFKRSCMPDGPKVGSINLSPRGDWRMPSDAVAWTLD